MIGRLKNWLVGGGVFLALELALAAAAAALLSHWTWLALTPRAVGASSLQPRALAPATPVKPNLFGASGVAETASGSKLKLVGLVSPRHAVFSLDGKARSASVGETIASGFVLREVHPDHVVVSNNGTLERVKLERRARR
jgi:general secretion pathway protein C